MTKRSMEKILANAGWEKLYTYLDTTKKAEVTVYENASGVCTVTTKRQRVKSFDFSGHDGKIRGVHDYEKKTTWYADEIIEEYKNVHCLKN